MKRNEVVVDGNVARFTMGVTAEDSKGEFKSVINVTMDFKGVTKQTLMQWICSGESRRVMLQRAVRKLSREKIGELAENGLKVHAGSARDLKSTLDKTLEAAAQLSPDQLKELIRSAKAQLEGFENE